MSAKGITIVGASAGSGKTYYLTEQVTTAIDPHGPAPVPLDGLIAVTYTKKAHAELAGRIRQKLVSAGAYDEAMRLPLAYVGTVHAACLRLLQEFALDAGLSPNVDVVAGDDAQLLRQALEAALEPEKRQRIDDLARRFQLRIEPRSKRVDWLTPVADIMDLARGNRIPPGELAAMAQRSVEGLLRLLPSPAADAAALDEILLREMVRALETLNARNDGSDATQKVIKTLEECLKRADDQELTWADWAKLSLLSPAKASADGVTRLLEAAVAYERHPRLHKELRELVLAMYDAARIGLSAYRQWKAERRVVDYVDMLDGALELVDHPRVQAELRGRLGCVVVDEFQDTSPIQLALFVKLHALTQRSVWVGDRKQCIFEYAGADPLLMDAVAGWVAADGGERHVLAHNYRSRPELVKACSELFVAALARHGFTRDEVEVSPKRSSLAALDPLPPFGLWLLESKNAEQDAEAIAAGVLRTLTTPGETPVVDRTTGETRDVRPGDIAVLVATNAEASAVAAALHARGIRAAIARAGLLSTPEGTLLDAALRFLLDEKDSLAAATVDAITGYNGQTPDSWLASRVRGEEVPTTGWRAALASVRDLLGVLSPAEALDETLAALDAAHLAARWPDPAQRVANLDALRALASGYEDRCAQEREAGTVAGLLRHFDTMRTETLRRDQMLASDDQHVPTDDAAVIVCTYHKCKGLEWPVVVMGSLAREDRRHAFEVCPETDRSAFDPQQPLAGRWIRYWPWPFGALGKPPLAAAAEQSAEGKRVALREEKERVRLLYVGFTRARDHLVLAVRCKKKKEKKEEKNVLVTNWLDTLATEDGERLLQLPSAAADGSASQIHIRHAPGSNGTQVAVRVWHSSGAAPVQTQTTHLHPWFARSTAVVDEPPSYRIAPSNAEHEWPDLTLPTIRGVVALSASMAIDGKVAEHDVLGDAVHAFLAADIPELTADERRENAARIIRRAYLIGLVRSEELMAAGDRLRSFVHEGWPGATWRREIPIETFVTTSQGVRRVAGTIDLLLETADGCILIDHKTFPGASEGAWRKKTAEFLPQLAAYTAALKQVDGVRVMGCWVHLPIGGGMVEVSV